MKVLVERKDALRLIDQITHGLVLLGRDGVNIDSLAEEPNGVEDDRDGIAACVKNGDFHSSSVT